MAFAIGQRNGVPLPYPDPAAMRRAYAFSDLQSFLDIYYAAAAVLLHEEDFFEMAWAYLVRAKADNVVRAEIFFDPQTHTARGVPLRDGRAGLSRAIDKAEPELGISAALIMCFLRHLTEREAFETLEQADALPRAVHRRRARLGRTGQSAGEVRRRVRHVPPAGAACRGPRRRGGPAGLDHRRPRRAGAERIDHGVRCLEDPAVVGRLVRDRVPLTVCPFSNVRLRVFDRLEDHNLPAAARPPACGRASIPTIRPTSAATWATICSARSPPCPLAPPTPTRFCGTASSRVSWSPPRSRATSSDSTRCSRRGARRATNAAAGRFGPAASRAGAFVNPGRRRNGFAVSERGRGVEGSRCRNGFAASERVSAASERVVAVVLEAPRREPGLRAVGQEQPPEALQAHRSQKPLVPHPKTPGLHQPPSRPAPENTRLALTSLSSRTRRAPGLHRPPSRPAPESARLASTFPSRPAPKTPGVHQPPSRPAPRAPGLHRPPSRPAPGTPDLHNLPLVPHPKTPDLHQPPSRPAPETPHSHQPPSRPAPRKHPTCINLPLVPHPKTPGVAPTSLSSRTRKHPTCINLPLVPHPKTPACTNLPLVPHPKTPGVHQPPSRPAPETPGLHQPTSRPHPKTPGLHQPPSRPAPENTRLASTSLSSRTRKHPACINLPKRHPSRGTARASHFRFPFGEIFPSPGDR